MAATRSSVCTSRADPASAPARWTQGVAAGGVSVAVEVGNEVSRRVMSAGLWVSGLPYLSVLGTPVDPSAYAGVWQKAVASELSGLRQVLGEEVID